MPTYTHICNRCSRRVTVRCPADKRNNEKMCATFVEPGSAGESTASGLDVTCDGTGILKRSEELDVTAHTPYSWKP